MKSHIVLVPATTGDIPFLSRIFRAAVAGTVKDYTPAQAAAWAARGTPARWHELFAGGLRFVLARYGDVPAGFASVSLDGYLHSLFVLPGYQRRGIASLLLSDAERYAFSSGAVAMTSDVSLTARPFFQRNGYRVERTDTVDIGGEKLLRFAMRRDNPAVL